MNRLETRRRVLWRDFAAPSLPFVIVVISAASAATFFGLKAYNQFEFHRSEKSEIEKLKEDRARLEAENATLKAAVARLEADNNPLKEKEKENGAQIKEETTKSKEQHSSDKLGLPPGFRPPHREAERNSGEGSNSDVLNRRTKDAVEGKDRVEK